MFLLCEKLACLISLVLLNILCFHRAFPLFDCEPFVLAYRSAGRKEGYAPPFERELATVGWSGPPFFGGESLGRIVCQIVGLALVTVACFFLSHEPPARSTFKNIKTSFSE